MIKRALLASTLLAAFYAGNVAGTPPRLPSDGAAVGERTRDWLDLQKSGAASVAEPQPIPGEVADKVYQRWVDSHARPIPEKFSREGISGGSAAR